VVKDTETADLELVKRMLSGSDEAFTEFFEGQFPRLYRFALVRLNRDADAAEEVVQSVMCRAISKLESYRGEAMLFTWLCTFCRHEISDWRRRSGMPLSDTLPEAST